MRQALTDWRHVQRNEPLEYNNPLEPHSQGPMFFTALDVEARCGLECAGTIWRELHRRHEAGERITNAVIQEVSTRVSGYNTESFLRLLRVTEQMDYTPVPYP